MNDVFSDERRIFFRAIVMTLISMRFEMEIRFALDQLYDDDINLSMFLHFFIQEKEELKTSVTDTETLLLSLGIGEWPQDIHRQMSWHIESVACLLWALGEISEMNPHDNGFDVRFVYDFLYNDEYPPPADYLSHTISHLLKKSICLRPTEETDLQLRRTEVMWQRCLIADAIRQDKYMMTTKPYCEIFPFVELGLPVGGSGDVIVGGKEFCDLNEDIESDIFPLTLSRLSAFYWIKHLNVVWDDIDLDYLDDFPR